MVWAIAEGRRAAAAVDTYLDAKGFTLSEALVTGGILSANGSGNGNGSVTAHPLSVSSEAPASPR